ncbi:MAG TPA: hypothetical protein VL742_19535 [Casimicrobiaceae bacterium]|nr:hypothetical protein [Casimicrobiaceae bacterium]
MRNALIIGISKTATTIVASVIRQSIPAAFQMLRERRGEAALGRER